MSLQQLVCFFDLLSVSTNSLSLYSDSLGKITRDDITFLLALFGSIGTASSWIYTFLRSRKRVSLKINDYTSHGHVIQFFINIQNNSSTPLYINSIILVHGNTRICCELIPKKIRKKGDDLLKTPMFPLAFSANESCYYFLEFVNCPDIPLSSGKSLDFVIESNRGTIKKSVTLENTSRYLHIE